MSKSAVIRQNIRFKQAVPREGHLNDIDLCNRRQILLNEAVHHTRRTHGNSIFLRAEAAVEAAM